MVETLLCERCGQSWRREAKRGRKPKLCPACQDGGQPAIPGMEPAETTPPMTLAERADDLTRRLETLKTPDAAEKRRERLAAILAARDYGGKK